MPPRRKYQKKAQAPVIAVPLDLDTEGFTYRKWGAIQTCKRGDWLVKNGAEVYTVDATTFARTYREISPGCYRKVTPVWAEQTATAGSIATKEGETHYEAGAFLVFNDENGGDGYAVTCAKFQELYEPAP